MAIVGGVVAFLILVLLTRRINTTKDMHKRNHESLTQMRYKHDSNYHKYHG